MTYPQDLMKKTPLWDSNYPIRFYRNHPKKAKKGGSPKTAVNLTRAYPYIILILC
ncbi:hypothetical protein SAMN04487897_101198 [Paenibacillus sp. yr247]|uniref:hypothetical protein n=1 Tax=Paenibacillus sp. yr247 TaxID=1761880 RepID=UPI0008813793|nr:hypothetical protein [Paenibacillus sp. yr247]SDM83381.1 hypothetical protein SAMN04487897_101198 [Paenibacillus sp. yr247]